MFPGTFRYIGIWWSCNFVCLCFFVYILREVKCKYIIIYNNFLFYICIFIIVISYFMFPGTFRYIGIWWSCNFVCLCFFIYILREVKCKYIIIYIYKKPVCKDFNENTSAEDLRPVAGNGAFADCRLD